MTERLKGWRYTGEKSGWIGEEWPVAGVPLAPEVPRSLFLDKGGRTARPRPRLRHTPLRPRRPRRHPQEVEARRCGGKGKDVGSETRGARRGSRGDGVRSAAAIGVCPQGFLDQAVQELRRKVRAVRPGERLIDPEGRKIGRITQWLEHLAPQLGTQVHFAFEAVVEFEPHAVAIAIGCFDNFNDHDTTPKEELILDIPQSDALHKPRENGPAFPPLMNCHGGRGLRAVRV